MKTTGILAAFASVAAALPSSSSSSSWSHCTTYTDTYDDLTTVAALPLLSPVGTYHGLIYEAFVVAAPAVAGGVKPKSAPNTAVATMETDLVQIGSVTLNPFGSIASASNSPFDLRSFYFGCAVDLHTSFADPSSGCTVAVTGFTWDGEQVPEATFAFSPDSTTAADLALAVLPSSYAKLRNVTFGVAVGSVATAATVLNLDNLVHCNY